MPCGDGGVPYPPTREEELDAMVPIPALCGILKRMTALEIDELKGRIDWVEAGINRDDFTEWWAMHQARDAEREQREQAAKPEASTLMTFDDWIHATNNAKEYGGHFMGHLAIAFQHADSSNQPPLKAAYHSHFFRFLSEDRRKYLQACADAA